MVAICLRRFEAGVKTFPHISQLKYLLSIICIFWEWHNFPIYGKTRLQTTTLFIASFCNISSVKYVKRYSLKLQTCASISSPLWGIEVTSVKNILCGGREEGVWLTAPTIISDTLVTGMLWGETIYWPQLVSIVAPVWSKHFNWKGTRWCTLHWSNS